MHHFKVKGDLKRLTIIHCPDSNLPDIMTLLGWQYALDEIEFSVFSLEKWQVGNQKRSLSVYLHRFAAIFPTALVSPAFVSVNRHLAVEQRELFFVST